MGFLSCSKTVKQKTGGKMTGSAASKVAYIVVVVIFATCVEIYLNFCEHAKEAGVFDAV